MYQYYYYAGIWSPRKSVEEASVFSYEYLRNMTSTYNKVYDDGSNVLWRNIATK